MLNFYQLPDTLIARMGALALNADAELPGSDTTTLMCQPFVAFDGATRRELAYRLPRGAVHDDTVTELLRMVNDGEVSVSRNGNCYFFVMKLG